MKARILIADDHEVVRQGIRALLEAQADWEVCGEAVNGREALELTERLKPDLVILDITMPDLNGLETTRLIRRSHPETEVLVLSVHDSEQLVRDVLEAGARGYVLKSDAGRELVQAVETVRQHKPFFTAKISAMVLEGYLKKGAGEAADSNKLTSREREILQLLAEGKTAKEISGILDISTKTVETHRMRLMRKLDLHSVVDLVRYAIRNNLAQL